MSRVVDLRDAVMTSIRENIPDFEHVDWHDGAFDDADIEEISSRTPAAYVTILTAPAEIQLVTGEMNADVRVYVNVVTTDSGKMEERGSDPEVWSLMERLAVLANLNNFACPFAAPANGVRFKRLRDPKLRREGVAVGCVEWASGLKIGVNRTLQREYPLGPRTTLREAALTTTADAKLYAPRRAMLLGEEMADCTPDPDAPTERIPGDP